MPLRDPPAGLAALFIGGPTRPASTRSRARRWRATALTSARSEDALDHGSIINLIVVDGRVRFEVSLDSAERAGHQAVRRACSRSRISCAWATADAARHALESPEGHARGASHHDQRAAGPALAMLLYETRAYRTRDDRGPARRRRTSSARASAAALPSTIPSRRARTSSLLRVRPQILGAVIENARGRTFAEYRAPDLAGHAAVPLGDVTDACASAATRSWSSIRSSRTTRLGRVLILARYELASRVRDYLGILAPVLIGSLAVAVLLSAALQRAITQPIIAVTEVAHSVMERRDFSLRVPKRSDDEVGYLVEAFNAMLSEVGRRAEALEQTNGRCRARWRSGAAPRTRCVSRTAARTSSSPRSRTSCAIRSRRCAIALAILKLASADAA
jgi:HAMP domain-containing protein